MLFFTGFAYSGFFAGNAMVLLGFYVFHILAKFGGLSWEVMRGNVWDVVGEDKYGFEKMFRIT